MAIKQQKANTSQATAPDVFLDLPEAPVLFEKPEQQKQQKIFEGFYFELRQSLQRLKPSVTETVAVEPPPAPIISPVIQQVISQAQTVVPVDMSVLELGVQRKVFIGLRTDGRAGTGKLSDPYDGSTVDKFDALMKDATRIPEFSEIHLLPGVFSTRGYELSRVAVSWRLRKGCKLRGCGMERTTLKLVDATVANGMYSVVKGWDFDGSYWDYSEVSDLTIDCDYANQPANIPTPSNGTQAVQLDSSRCRISRVRAINFGGAATVGEVFLISIGIPVTSSGAIYDLVIEDCIAERPVYIGNNGSTLISFLYGETADGLMADTVNNVIRNCVCDGTYTDGFIPYGSSHAGYPAGRHYINGLTIGAGYDSLIENNEVRNCGVGCYADTWSQKYLTIRGNRFHNIQVGPYAAMGNVSPFTGLKFKIQRLIVEGNEIALRPTVGLLAPFHPSGIKFMDALDSADYVFRELIIRGNKIQLVDANMNVANYQEFGIHVTNTEQALIEDNVIRLPNVDFGGPSPKASILTKKVLRLNARNNRRPEDNSIIVPWSGSEFVADEVYEQEKAYFLRR